MIMRLLYTTLAFLCFWNTGFSQSYIPLLNQNFFWDIGYYEQGHICDLNDNSAPNRFFINEDTTISNKIYRVFWQYDYYTEGNSQPLCPPFIIDTIAKRSGVLMREDITQQKVYRYDQNTKSEYLLYDFSVNIGDSVYLHDLDGQYGMIYKIDTIVTGDGVQRRRFYQDIEHGGESYYVEGIGGVQGFFNSPVSFFENGWVPLCVKTKDDIIIEGYNDCSASFTSIDNYSDHNQTISIWPSQVVNTVNIFSPVSQEVFIYDLLGHQVYTNTINKGENSLHLDFLSSQVYIVKASRSNMSKKIMKL
jgi:hypothetical protein